MKKTFIIIGLFMLALLASCKKPQKPVDEDITFTFTGLKDETLLIGDTLDLMEGVKVMGSNEVDYTDKVTILLASTAVSRDGNIITAVQKGKVMVRYRVEVEIDGVELEDTQFRNIDIDTPPKPVGEMISNGKFLEGLAFWETYTGDGGAMEITFEDEAAKIVVSGVGQTWEPRLTQMGVPFEKGKMYRISFRAKALEDKKINIQVGEILEHDPWFTDFKDGQTEHRVITTEWATYTMDFLMRLENDRGGVLFEFGKIGTEDVKTTIWLTDVKAEEIEIPDDETPPVITVSDKEVLKDSTVDLSSFIHVNDAMDGVIPFDELEIVIKDGDIVVDEIDTSVLKTYTVSVTATDKAGNSATETFEVKVVSMNFDEANLLENGDFEATGSDVWQMWKNEGITASLVIENGEAVVDVETVGGEEWHVQLYQEETFSLIEGKTYRLKFDAKASAARDIAFQVVDGINPSNPVFFLNETVALTTDMQNFEYIFTVTAPVEKSKVIFLLAQAVGSITFDNIEINEAQTQTLLKNTEFKDVVWGSFVEAAVANYTYDGKARIEVTSLSASQNYQLQLEQKGLNDQRMGIMFAPGTYTLSFDAVASKDWTVAALLIHGNGDWHNFIESNTVVVKDTTDTYTLTFVIPEDINKDLVFKFEFGTGIANFAAGEGVLEWLEFDNISIKDADDKEYLINGTFETAPLHWVADHAGAGEGAITSSAHEDGMKISVTTLGGEPYQPHLWQEFHINEAGNYTLKFVLNASVARTLRTNLVIPLEGFRSLLEGSKYDIVITEEQVGQYVEYEVNFSVDGPIGNPVKFEFDFGPIAEGDVVGDFIFKQIQIYKVY